MSHVFQLRNGILVSCDQRPGTGSVGVQVQFRTGSGHDAAVDAGLTQLTVSALSAGTTTRTRAQIAEDIESRGGSMGGSVSRNNVTYGLMALASDAARSFGVMADVLRNPVFAADDIAHEQQALQHRLKSEASKPDTQSRLAFMAGVFAGQSFGLNPAGQEDTVAALTADKLHARHRDLLANPEDIVISFAGDIDAETARALAEQHFGDLAAGNAPARATPLFAGGDTRTSTDNSQLNLTFGFPTVGSHDPDRFAVRMLHELLAGGMSRPLFQEIREKRGLVYSVHAQYTTIADTGLFYISAGTGQGNAGELMSVTFDLLRDVARNGFSDADLQEARRRLLRERLAGEESVYNLAGRSAAQLLTQKRLVSFAEYQEKIESVTMDDIRRVCAGLLADGRYALGGVGPQDTMPTPEEIHAMAAAALDGITVPAKPDAVLHAHGTFNTAAAESVAADAPAITVLPNGATVLTVKRAGLLACGAWVNVGADNEPVAINGASHMIEHMMFKGTPSYAAGEIDRAVEGRLAGGLNAYTDVDRTAYYFYNLDPRDMTEIVNICSEMVFKANLSHDEFDGHVIDGKKQKGERDVVLEEIKRANDNISRRQWYLLNATAYPDQPHGRTILGPSSVIAQLTVDEMAAYRDAFYVPSNVVYCAVGPVDHADFVKAVETATAGLASGSAATLPLPTYHGGLGLLETAQTKLCNITLAAEGYPVAHKSQAALDALAKILGDGHSARLRQTCVLDRKLTTGIGAYSNAYKNGGLFLVSTAAEPQNIKPLLQQIYADIRHAADTISEDELSKVKANMEMEQIKTFETVNEACDAYARAAQNHGRLVTREEILDEIRALTVSDIRNAARHVLKSKPAAAIVHPPGIAPGLLPTEQEVASLHRDAQEPARAKARTHRP